MKKLIFIFPLIFIFIYFFILNGKEIEDSIEKISINTTPTVQAYESPISISYLRKLTIASSELKIERELAQTNSYKQYIASYQSEGFKVYSLLTVPKTSKPANGFPVIIFNHGYIPPKSYSTTSNYVSYVDYLARNGFIVMKIDMRGHGNSEGVASGSYFSNTYLIDVLSAYESLKTFSDADIDNVGLWGHSMAGNLVLRTLLVTDKFKAGVIWAGAVYSYKDFAKYRISDNSYVAPRTMPQAELTPQPGRETSPEISKIRSREEIDFNSPFWKSISLTENISFLNSPLQLHHPINDYVVNVGYSRDLVEVLKENNKKHEYFEYSDGGHNISGFSFVKAMDQTVRFFKENLK